MSLGLGHSVELINIPFLVLSCNPLVYRLYMMAIEYVEEAEADMRDCYNSMTPQERRFIDDNSMFGLITDELTGQQYYA
jgi:hypothetical protein